MDVLAVVTVGLLIGSAVVRALRQWTNRPHARPYARPQVTRRER